ncbi:unnamed protein product [Linum trigynum]|uniref:Uncharacterized protein n=1 Tax=Linum trigynum TaxID=586398 RepID=A0AAV2GLC1_9ROSI
MLHFSFSDLFPPSTAIAKKSTPATVLFQDYYNEWFKTLKTKLLPLVHRSLSRPFPAVAALLQCSPPPPLSLLLRRPGPRRQPPSPPPAVAQLTWQQLHCQIKIHDGDTE